MSIALLPQPARAENTVTGVFIGPGVECPQFQTQDGEQISLRGDGVDRLVANTTLHLTGQFLRASPCMQGRTFRVTSVMPASPPNH